MSEGVQRLSLLLGILGACAGAVLGWAFAEGAYQTSQEWTLYEQQEAVFQTRTGRCEGRKPFGHYPGEKAILDRMKALRKDGLGFDRLAAQMNTEGLRRRKGTPWDGKRVNRILTRLQAPTTRV